MVGVRTDGRVGNNFKKGDAHSFLLLLIRKGKY